MTPEDIIKKLELIPHPEGGHYRETWRDHRADGSRGHGTAIYFLLDDGPGSAWHRVLDGDEVWCFHDGAPLELTIESASGVAEVTRLGPAFESGCELQAVVPRGLWQKARSIGPWTLVSCVVGPAFVFDAFEMREQHDG